MHQVLLIKVKLMPILDGLLDTSINPQDINSSNELVITHQFATNQISSIGFLNTNQNDAVLSYITNINNFSNYNNLGSSKATDLIEFSEKNEINTANGIIKDHYQLYNLISARNTEVRSRHGFASSKYSKMIVLMVFLDHLLMSIHKDGSEVIVLEVSMTLHHHFLLII